MISSHKEFSCGEYGRLAQMLDQQDQEKYINHVFARCRGHDLSGTVNGQDVLGLQNY